MQPLVDRQQGSWDDAAQPDKSQDGGDCTFASGLAVEIAGGAGRCCRAAVGALAAGLVSFEENRKSGNNYVGFDL
jgi:hypothetical protein